MGKLRILCVVLSILSLTDCQCTEDVAAGNCRAYIRSFFFNQKTQMCDCFIYSGCSGNSNRFNDLQSCMTTCNVSTEKQKITSQCDQMFKSDKEKDKYFGILEEEETSRKLNDEEDEEMHEHTPASSRSNRVVPFYIGLAKHLW